MSKNIVVVTTSWGFEEGGINSFNYDFCSELIKQISGESWKLSIVAFKASEKPLDKTNLILVDSHKTGNRDKLNVEDISEDEQHLLFKSLSGRDTIFIGHDRISGQCATQLSKIAERQNIKSLS